MFLRQALYLRAVAPIGMVFNLRAASFVPQLSCGSISSPFSTNGTLCAVSSGITFLAQRLGVLVANKGYNNSLEETNQRSVPSLPQPGDLTRRSDASPHCDARCRAEESLPERGAPGLLQQLIH